MNPSTTTLFINTPLPRHCPVTGLPVYGDASWIYASPGGGYRLRVSFIGDRIAWLQPQGHVRLRHVRKGMALLEDVLLAMLPEASPFIIIHDYSSVTGASLNARRFVMQTLRQKQQIQAYIVYGFSHIFRIGFELGQRFGSFPFDIVVALNYEEAVTIGQARSIRIATRAGTKPAASSTPLSTDGGTDATPHDRAVEPLAEFTAELLEYVGGINLETYGFEPSYPAVPFNHPFRPVYDALTLLRDDMQAILQRHREAREKLERRENELTEKQTILNETHSALNILLAARQEERQRLEVRIKDRFDALLRPLVDGLARTAMAPRQRTLIRLLRGVIGRIGTSLACESKGLQTRFTARERMIAYLFTTGQNPREMAHTLGLSYRTIENHCQRMRVKIGLKGHHPTLKDWLTRTDPGVLEQSRRPR